MLNLQVTMPDNSIWEINTIIIAKDRASYYASKGGNYEEIYKETLEDLETLIDWGENNINWNDIKNDAIMVKGCNVDYEDGWCNGFKQIIER